MTLKIEHITYDERRSRPFDALATISLGSSRKEPSFSPTVDLRGFDANLQVVSPIVLERPTTWWPRTAGHTPNESLPGIMAPEEQKQRPLDAHKASDIPRLIARPRPSNNYNIQLSHTGTTASWPALRRSENVLKQQTDPPEAEVDHHFHLQRRHNEQWKEQRKTDFVKMQKCQSDMKAGKLEKTDFDKRPTNPAVCYDRTGNLLRAPARPSDTRHDEHLKRDTPLWKDKPLPQPPRTVPALPPPTPRKDYPYCSQQQLTRSQPRMEKGKVAEVEILRDSYKSPFDSCEPSSVRDPRNTSGSSNSTSFFSRTLQSSLRTANRSHASAQQRRDHFNAQHPAPTSRPSLDSSHHPSLEHTTQPSSFEQSRAYSSIVSGEKRKSKAKAKSKLKSKPNFIAAALQAAADSPLFSPEHKQKTSKTPKRQKSDSSDLSFQCMGESQVPTPPPPPPPKEQGRSEDSKSMTKSNSQSPCNVSGRAPRGGRRCDINAVDLLSPCSKYVLGEGGTGIADAAAAMLLRSELPQRSPKVPARDDDCTYEIEPIPPLRLTSQKSKLLERYGYEEPKRPPLPPKEQPSTDPPFTTMHLPWPPATRGRNDSWEWGDVDPLPSLCSDEGDSLSEHELDTDEEKWDRPPIHFRHLSSAAETNALGNGQPRQITDIGASTPDIVEQDEGRHRSHHAVFAEREESATTRILGVFGDWYGCQEDELSTTKATKQSTQSRRRGRNTEFYDSYVGFLDEYDK